MYTLVNVNEINEINEINEMLSNAETEAKIGDRQGKGGEAS
jgi:hypothetical protein